MRSSYIPSYLTLLAMLLSVAIKYTQFDDGCLPIITTRPVTAFLMYFARPCVLYTMTLSACSFFHVAQSRQLNRHPRKNNLDTHLGIAVTDCSNPESKYDYYMSIATASQRLYHQLKKSTAGGQRLSESSLRKDLQTYQSETGHQFGQKN